LNDSKAESYCIDFDADLLSNLLDHLKARNVSSLIVEGGAHTLQSFIAADLWDEARVFVGTETFGDGVQAPTLNCTPYTALQSGKDLLQYFYHPRVQSLLVNGELPLSNAY
jgi:diaminohydroxyphosphoribosylaminopyrimidine deaminase/5-amino-6-(5-phosphoribosylamino)uracil reductase